MVDRILREAASIFNNYDHENISMENTICFGRKTRRDDIYVEDFDHKVIDARLDISIILAEMLYHNILSLNSDKSTIDAINVLLAVLDKI